ncbi:hypothetical protein IJJ36_00650 [Candidatus Saccharibacteria bacterium]|nr:hypothetical protein [Candidatus Saccharibacteria bacterium]
MNHENLLHDETSENPWTGFSTRELLTTSTNQTCRFYLRGIERAGRLEKVARFIDEKLNVEPEIYATTEAFFIDNPEYQDALDEVLSESQKTAIKRYSGFSFAWINSVERGLWDYDKLGAKTPEKEAEYKADADEISAAISNAPTPEKDFLTFRGTNLDGFRSYGVQNLDDLKKLEGQFYLEDGFTSTALAHERSFSETGPDSFWIKKSDIELRYHIPAGSHDSLALFSHELSYNPEQTEVLINRHSLSYISNISFDENGRVVVDALLIPREIYDSAAE